mgnify:CR=1 FL=1
MHSIYPEDSGKTQEHNQLRTKQQGYGKHSLGIGSRYYLVIYKTMNSLTNSSGLTCLPRGGSGSTIDYILRTREVTQTFKIFTISPRPIGAYHTCLSITPVSNTPSQLLSPSSPSLSLHIVIHFTHELTETYNQHGTRIDHLDPSTPSGCSHLPTLHYTPYLGHQ